MNHRIGPEPGSEEHWKLARENWQRLLAAAEPSTSAEEVALKRMDWLAGVAVVDAIEEGRCSHPDGVDYLPRHPCWEEPLLECRCGAAGDAVARGSGGSR